MTVEITPGYKQTELGIVPEDWQIQSLPEALQFISGKAHEQFINEAGPYVVVNSKFISTEGSVRKYSSENFCPAKRGDVLMVMSDLPNGRALAKCYLVKEDKTYAVNQRVCIFRPIKGSSEYFYYLLNRNKYFMQFDDGVQQTHLLNPMILNCQLKVPSEREQYRIGRNLADIDSLISSMDQLIIKKSGIQQAAMQQLLTGQRRLPGFSEKWEEKRLGDVCKITTGKKDVNEGNPSGQYPFFTCAREHTYSDLYSFDCEAILVAGNGEVGNLNYYFGKFEAYQRTYVLYGFDANTAYIWHALKFGLAASLGIGKIGSSIPYIKKSDLTNFELPLPTPEEQAVIADTISDMNAEIKKLEVRREKLSQIKQGMMQALLTGTIRLTS